MKPVFFKSAAAFRKWLETHHASEPELWAGFYKAGSGKRGLSYKEAVDEGLCFGWIDGVRKSLDDERYVQRFSPRAAKSYWSAINTRRAKELIAEGRMHPAGAAAFARRDTAGAARYSFERETPEFTRAQRSRFKANPAAWAYFEAEAPWYRRVVTHWVTSAKRDETRERRLATLIADSEKGRRIRGVPAKRRTANVERRTKVERSKSLQG